MNHKINLGDVTPLTEVYFQRSCLSEFEIEKIKELHELDDTRHEAKVGYGEGNIDNNYRRSTVSWFTPEFIEKHNCYDIVNKIANEVNMINDEVFKFDLLDIEPLQVTKYDSYNQGMYNPHMDASSQQRNITRKLSFVIQLSDLDDFEGGSFVYENNLEAVNVRETQPHTLAKGNIILFSSFLTHGVLPVTKGVRYSLVGWCIGPRFR